MLFAAVARERWLAKVFVPVAPLVRHHCRRAFLFFDAITVFEEVTARAAVAFDKGVPVRWAKRGVRTLFLRAVRVAPVAVLFNLPAVFLSVAASALFASFVELRAFASQPILALAVNRKGFRAASFAHLPPARSDPRSSTSGQGRFATWCLAQATFGNAGSPARRFSYREEARGNAARLCAARAVEQVVAVAAPEAGARAHVAIFAAAIVGTAIAWRGGGGRGS